MVVGTGFFLVVGAIGACVCLGFSWSVCSITSARGVGCIKRGVSVGRTGLIGPSLFYRTFVRGNFGVGGDLY